MQSQIVLTEVTEFDLYFHFIPASKILIDVMFCIRPFFTTYIYVFISISRRYDDSVLLKKLVGTLLAVMGWKSYRIT